MPVKWVFAKIQLCRISIVYRFQDSVTCIFCEHRMHFHGKLQDCLQLLTPFGFRNQNNIGYGTNNFFGENTHVWDLFKACLWIRLIQYRQNWLCP